MYVKSLVSDKDYLTMFVDTGYFSTEFLNRFMLGT